MITCFLKYTIDPLQLPVFEEYGKGWIKLVNQYGGHHHGYFLPSEGANNIALALFSFESMADYENYRKKSMTNEECLALFRMAEQTKCIINYERTFLSPVFR